MTDSQTFYQAPSDIFDNLIGLLSNKDIWKNIYLLTDVQNIINQYQHIFPYINGKNKAKTVMHAIANNNEITPYLKEEINKHIEQLGMTYNKHEILFENISQLHYARIISRCDALAELITNKLVNPNFQTDIGNVFHIIAKMGGEFDEKLVAKLKLLMNCGCDMFALNSEGKTPIQVAIDAKNIQISHVYKNLSLEKIVNIPKPVLPIVSDANNILDAYGRPMTSWTGETNATAIYNSRQRTRCILTTDAMYLGFELGIIIFVGSLIMRQ